MVRAFWVEKIEAAFRKKSVLWLNGVRRSGKTTLAKSLPGAEYFDCELPRIRESLADPEFFLKKFRPKTRLILDEIHRLGNPAEVLKIAADHFPKLQILATGSSTLAATDKFRDALTDRKTNLWLGPMLLSESSHLERTVDDRMRFGGLPRFLIEKIADETEYQEWLDQFWAKDVSELFRVEKRHSFMKFGELLLTQSGRQFEANAFSGPCEVSRQSIQNYLAILEVVHFAHVIRPFSTRKSKEIVGQPKVYAFDTGFVSFFNGVERIRASDRGFMLEHLALNEMHAVLQSKNKIQYWRTKQGHEIDFIVLPKPGGSPIAVECKWNHSELDSKNLVEFRKLYPKVENWIISGSALETNQRRFGSIETQVIPILGLQSHLEATFKGGKT